jgi:signal transduction histidine kinase
MQPTGERQGGETVRERLGLLADMEARPGAPAESLAEVAHDARNMVTALGLYCNLLQEPGVLAEEFRHYAGELELVTAASRRLVAKLATMNTLPAAADDSAARLEELLAKRGARDETRPAAAPEPINNLAVQTLALRNLLAALAGPGIELTMTASGGARPVYLTGEGLTRVLVNLVKNAAEAMPRGGHILIHLNELEAVLDEDAWLTLTVEDNGNGIAPEALESLFESGYTTRNGRRARMQGRRGLGLAITRSLVEAAGGRVHAANRDPSGACIQIELPVRD